MNMYEYLQSGFLKGNYPEYTAERTEAVLIKIIKFFNVGIHGNDLNHTTICFYICNPKLSKKQFSIKGGY